MENEGAKFLILGIDPGIAETGWAVLECGHGTEERVVYSDYTRTSPEYLLAVRIESILQVMERIIEQRVPHAIAMESLVLLPRRGTVASYELTGALRMLAWEKGYHIYDYKPSQVKKAISGHGNSNKEAMAKAADSVLGFRSSNTHMVDAVAVAYAHMMKLESTCP